MKIVKFITGVSKKLAKAESWRLPSKEKALPALPAPPLDEERPEVKPVVAEKDEEKAEAVKLEPVVEEAPIQPTTKLEPVQEPKPPGKRKALLIGIQFYPDPAAEAGQEPPVAPSVPPLPSSGTASTAAPTQDTAARTTPSLAASSSLASITSRAKAKFMQTMSISSPLASTSNLPSSSASPPPPPPLLAGAKKKSYAAAVSPRAGLSSAPSAWPALGSAAPAFSPTPMTPRTGGVTPAPPTKVPLKPGRSMIQQQQKAFAEKAAAKKEKEKEKTKEKKKKKKEKKEQSGHQHEGSTSSAQSYALKGCHRDVQEMQKMLVDLYHYSPSDIITMIDTQVNVDSKSDLLPTRDNIIKQIQELVKGAVEGDRFFFFFAGHSTQEETDSLDEEDGKDELIVTYDNDLIRDDELRKMLVAPLPPGVKLTAVFDSCHSASLLDLDHFRCNRTWVPWKNKGRRRSLSKLNAVVRKAAAPLSPRRSSAWFNSPISTTNPLYPLIIDLDRLKRAVSRKKRRDAAAIQANDGGKALEEAKKSEAEELQKAQERAQEVLNDSLGDVPEASDSKENPDTTTANPSAGKENVKPRRREPPTKRAKIVPPPVYEGWRKTSLDRVMVGGGGSGRGSLSSEVAPPSATAARPISILASGTSAAIIAGTTGASSSDGPAAAAAQEPKRPKIKLPPIRTTSLHPDDVPTQPVTPVTNANTAYVTFTPQTYTPQWSRRESVAMSRRDSISLAHQVVGVRRESGQAGVVLGMSQVLEEAFDKRANPQKGDTQLTDRTDVTDRTDRTDGTYPASDVSHDSGVFWLVDEPDEFDDEEGEDQMSSPQGQDPGPDQFGVSSLGAGAPLAMGVAPTTTTMAGHAISSAAAASGLTSVPVRATSLLKPKAKGGCGDKAKKKRHPRRCLSPEERFCTGWCRKQYEEEKVDGKKVMPFVISLSAAKDGQQAWEDESGASMTQHLVGILRKDPSPSLEKLLGLISHELHETYLNIHSSARDYRKKAREVNKKLLSKGKEMREVAAVEMNNFQDPQVSSLWPLDMKNELWDP